MLKRNPIIVAALALISLCGCTSTPRTEVGANTYYAAKKNTVGAFWQSGCRSRQSDGRGEPLLRCEWS